MERCTRDQKRAEPSHGSRVGRYRSDPWRYRTGCPRLLSAEPSGDCGPSTRCAARFTDRNIAHRQNGSGDDKQAAPQAAFRIFRVSAGWAGPLSKTQRLFANTFENSVTACSGMLQARFPVLERAPIHWPESEPIEVLNAAARQNASPPDKSQRIANGASLVRCHTGIKTFILEIVVLDTMPRSDQRRPSGCRNRMAKAI